MTFLVWNKCRSSESDRVAAAREERLASLIGARETSFQNIKSIAECLADKLINPAKGSSNSYANKKKDEL